MPTDSMVRSQLAQSRLTAPPLRPLAAASTELAVSQSMTKAKPLGATCYENRTRRAV